MSHVPRPHPDALPHGPLREVLPSLYVVQGTVRMPMPVAVTFGRAMVVVKEGERLVLVNTLRLDEAGLRALDALGKVTDVIRLAANHGMDDPFYAERYGAKVWVVGGQRYTAGFATSAPDTYFTPHVEMSATTELPLAGASLYVIASTPPEGLLVLERHGGVIVSGDCLQNMARPDERFNWLGRVSMWAMGFMKPHNIGPGWVGQCKPPKHEVRGILDLKFENVLPCHGEPVLGDAHELYRPAIERVAKA